MTLAIQRRGRRAEFCISHVQPFLALPPYLLELYLLNGPSPEMDYALLLLHYKLCILRSDTSPTYRPFPSSSSSEELTRLKLDIAFARDFM